MELENEVLKRIVPSAEERNRIDRIAEKLKNTVQEYLDSHGIQAELRLVGSYAKDTYLSDPDLDLFVMFPYGTTRAELERTGLEIGENVLHGDRMYAEHPYTRALFEGTDVDLVPCIKIPDTDKLETAVDRTPFHATYVIEHLKEGQNDQIRLLKKFMKAISTYGAEPKNRGFSGYLCELLVLKYGSFDGVVKAAAEDWNIGTRLWLEKKGPAMDGALVFYDPVDSGRNVASAVHQDTLCRFITACRDYLQEPSEIFFFRPSDPALCEKKLEKMADTGGFRLITLVFGKPDTNEENLYAQIWKTQAAVQAQLGHYGFNVLRSTHGFDGKRMTVMFMLTCDRLPGCIKREGPTIDSDTAEGFFRKWDTKAIVKPFIENGRWWAVVPRQYRSAKEMLRNEIAQAGIGKNVDISTMEILDHDTTVLQADRKVLCEMLDPTPYWRRK